MRSFIFLLLNCICSALCAQFLTIDNKEWDIGERYIDLDTTDTLTHTYTFANEGNENITITEIDNPSWPGLKVYYPKGEIKPNEKGEIHVELPLKSVNYRNARRGVRLITNGNPLGERIFIKGNFEKVYPIFKEDNKDCVLYYTDLIKQHAILGDIGTRLIMEKTSDSKYRITLNFVNDEDPFFKIWKTEPGVRNFTFEFLNGQKKNFRCSYGIINMADKNDYEDSNTLANQLTFKILFSLMGNNDIFTHTEYSLMFDVTEADIKLFYNYDIYKLYYDNKELSFNLSMAPTFFYMFNQLNPEIIKKINKEERIKRLKEKKEKYKKGELEELLKEGVKDSAPKFGLG